VVARDCVDCASVSTQTESPSPNSTASTPGPSPQLPLVLPPIKGSADSGNLKLEVSEASIEALTENDAFLNEITSEAIQLAKAGDQKAKKKTKKATALRTTKMTLSTKPPVKAVPAAPIVLTAPEETATTAVDEEGWKQVVCKPRSSSNSTVSTSAKSAPLKKRELRLSSDASLKAVKKAIAQASALAAVTNAPEVTRPRSRTVKPHIEAGSGNRRADAPVLQAIPVVRAVAEVEAVVEVKKLSKAITKTVEVVEWKTSLVKFAPLAKKPRGAVVSSLTVAYTVAKN